MRRSRSMRSAAAIPSSGAARTFRSHSRSEVRRRSYATALVSSRRSSYSVRPRLDARVGESSYSSFKNESTSEANADGTLSPPRELAGAIRVSLEEYQRKRDFKRTPEPKGQRPKSETTRRSVG